MIAASTIYRPFVVGVRAAGCCDHSAARLFYQIILRSSTVCLFDVCLLFIVVTIQQCCRFADCRGWGAKNRGWRWARALAKFCGNFECITCSIDGDKGFWYKGRWIRNGR
jgi:hypothetical protein